MRTTRRNHFRRRLEPTSDHVSRLHAYSTITALAALSVVIAGALVNSNYAALSVPDWPLSYGQLILTKWSGNTVYEQSHRVAALVAGLLISGLWLSMRRRGDLPWARRATVAGAWQYVVQVLLGGLVVLTLDPPWLAIIHVALASSVFATLALVAFATSGWWRKLEESNHRHDGDAALKRRSARIVVILALLQIILGAATRHPPAGEVGSAVSLLGHLVNAIVLLVFVIRLPRNVTRMTASVAVRRLAVVLLALVIVQWIAAVPLFFISPEPDAMWPPPDGFPLLHTVHVAIAALILAFAVSVYAALGRARQAA